MEDRGWRTRERPSSIFDLPSLLFSFVTDFVNRTADVIRYVQRSVGALCQSGRAMQPAVLSRTAGVREVDCEILERSGLPALHRQEHHAESLLRLRCAIPRTVERDERAVPVSRRELRAGVEHHVVRSPVARKDVLGLFLRRAARVLLAVAAVLGPVHQLLLLSREVAVGPAKIVALENVVDLLAGILGVVVFAEAPVAELVAAVHGRPERVVARVHGERNGVAHAGCKPRSIRRMLPGLVTVERPDAPAYHGLLAWMHAGRFPLAADFGGLARFRGGADVHVDRAADHLEVVRGVPACR